jgi:hypothetical protein
MEGFVITSSLHVSSTSALDLNQPRSELMHRDDVRKRWELEKLTLTRYWKQRHRDAIKKQRKGGLLNDLE